ncbi:MAG: glycosyltransferase family 4 protein [Eubacteriales bacterium]|nr:glycosyltransferase family 4 protein [Eubacteriales bacterium]
MKVLMVGVDKTSLGGMLTVVENYLNNKQFVEDTNLLYIPVTTHGGKLKKLWFSLKGYIQVVKTIKRKKPDIVHVHMSDGGSAFREGLILLTAKKMGCHTIAHMHGGNFEYWYYSQKKSIQILVAKLLENAEEILVLGKTWVEIYRKVTRNTVKVDVLYNAVVLPKKRYYSKTSPNFLFLSNMMKNKGIDDLLYVISTIRESIPPKSKFLLFGADRKGDIVEKIQALSLEDVVEYKGWLTNEDKEVCFRNVRANILPSYYEGLPMTILETMAFGIPNIATNIAAIPEVVEQNKNGILIEPGDKEALKSAILRIIDSDDLCEFLSKNAYETIRQEFSLSAHIRKLQEIYRSLLF